MPDARVHWSMEPDADKLRVTVRDGSCLCGEGKHAVEGGWPIMGWEFHSGQCCDCMNIRVYMNGAEPVDWKSGDKARVEYADENSDEIHICDLDKFIEMLQAIQEAKRG